MTGTELPKRVSPPPERESLGRYIAIGAAMALGALAVTLAEGMIRQTLGRPKKRSRSNG